VVARRGPRRKTEGSARDDILRAAQRLFPQRAISGISLRAIAHEAGVNPALTLYYFESKEELIIEALGASLRPVMEDVFGGRPLRRGVGREAVLGFLRFWDPPERRQTYAAMVLSAQAEGRISHALRRTIVKQLETQLSGLVPQGELRARAGLYTSQVVGLGVSRYVLKLEPLASMPAELLAESIGPTLDRYLVGPLPG
jgi:AcrR family transcriptional regulator